MELLNRVTSIAKPTFLTAGARLHGEIGSLLGFSNLCEKSQPLPSGGVFSGLREGLAKDDYGDVKE